MTTPERRSDIKISIDPKDLVNKRAEYRYLDQMNASDYIPPLKTNIPPELTPYLPVIVFDGDCGLCNRLSGWILAHQSSDPSQRLFVVGGESPFGQHLLRRLSLSKLAETTILFVTPGGVLTRMDASYAIWRRLRAPWAWLPFLYGWMPRFVLNALYDAVASRRKRQTCRVDDMRWRQEYAELILDNVEFPQ